MRNVWLPAWILAVLLIATAGPAAAQPAPPALEVTGATYVEFDEASGLWQLRGSPVVVTRGPKTIRAPEMTYDGRGQVVRGTGGVTYTDGASSLTAAVVTVWLREERLLAEGQVAAVLREEQRESRLQSERLEVWTKERRAVGTGGAVLRRGEMTATGDRIEYDERTQRAVATGKSTLATPEGTVTADRIDAQLDREEVTAEGHVRLIQRDLDGAAPKAVLRRREGIAVLSGGATVRYGQNTATAQVVTVDLKTNRVVATGQAHLVVYPGR